LTAWQRNSASGIIFVIFSVESGFQFSLKKFVSWSSWSKHFFASVY